MIAKEIAFCSIAMIIFFFQVLTNRLVSEDGIINPKAFYNYVTAWTSNDAMAYSASQSAFHPLPMEWYHIAHDMELKSKMTYFLYCVRNIADMYWLGILFTLKHT